MPKAGGELKSAMLIGMVGYENTADFLPLLDHVNNSMLGREPQMVFILCDETSELPKLLKGVFQANGRIILYTKPVKSRAAIGERPIFADVFEIL
jgi:hypothetical protein